METSLRSATAQLQKGSFVLKYCRRGPPHVCFLQLSPLENELQWVSIAGKLRALSLSTIDRVVTGQTTQVFRRYPGLFSCAVSFSVLYCADRRERSLDVVCKSADELSRWLLGLKIFVARRGPPRSVPGETLTQLAWPREILIWGQHAVASHRKARPFREEGSQDPSVNAATLTAGRKALLPLALRDVDGLDVAAICFSGFLGAILTADGGLFAWRASSARCVPGCSLLQSVDAPQHINLLSGVRLMRVACGGACTAAVTVGGELLLMGDSSACEPAAWVPRSIPLFGIQVKEVTCGPFHSALLSADGCLFTWGEGAFGALGHGSLASQLRPRRVEALADHSILQVACGVWHSAAVGCSKRDAGGAAPRACLFTWGNGEAGQLGIGTRTSTMLPVSVVGELALQPVKQVGCGAHHTLALTDQGAVFYTGNAGAGSTQMLFARVAGALSAAPIQQIACGERHSLAVRVGGREVYSWGCGAGGRLGHGDEKDCDMPKLVVGLSKRDIHSVVCGPECSAVIAAAVRLTVAEKAAAARDLQVEGFSCSSPTVSAASASAAAQTRPCGVVSVSPPPVGRSFLADFRLPNALNEVRLQLAAQQVFSAQLQAELASLQASVRGQVSVPAVQHDLAAILQPPADPSLQAAAPVSVLRRVRAGAVFDDEAAAEWWSSNRQTALGIQT